MTPVTIEDLEAADRLIEGGIVRTPCRRSETLSAITGAEVWVKFENLQFTGSFKDRGSLRRLLDLDADERARGVIALSAGNHAQGVAHHAARLGVPATIVMPGTTPYAKVRNTRALGAEVVQAGADLAACVAVTEALLAERGLTLVHPFDDPLIIAGQGTCGLEIARQAGELDAVVVPVGGGGLAAGMGVALAARRPGCEVIGVQTRRYDAAVRRRHPEVSAEGEPASGPTLADGIAVKQPGVLNAQIIDACISDLISVEETSIERAIALYVDIEKTVAEGAGAASLAALIEHRDRFAGRRVCVVLSGGSIDARLLASVLLRDLVRAGRLTRLRVEADDVPGSLAGVTRTVSDHGADVVEVSHHRLLTDVPARRVDLELVVETRDAEHTAALVEALRSAGNGVDVRSV